MKPIKFENLDAWKQSQDLAVSIYTLTSEFPKSEQFALSNQMRRAVSSISANIAEGFGRAGNKEKIQFYKIAYGSLLEVKSFLYLAQKLGYCDNKIVLNLLNEIESVQKLINGLSRSIKSRE